MDETPRARRRKLIMEKTLESLKEDWTPARVLVEMINNGLPQCQELTISMIGHLIRTLIRDGIIEKQSCKLQGRQETQYRLIPLG
jgi:hypothetical protein